MIDTTRTGGRVRDERGIALITVIAMGSVLSMLMVAAISYSIATTKSARSTQDWSGAMAAAYAGIEEYQSRLAADTTYFQYGNPASTFSSGTVALPPAGATNNAFALGQAGAWADVAGSGGLAKFRYEVDSSDYYLEGKIRLRSTGLVDGETRSIVADLKQQGFIDFLYFTDYEIQDPQLSGVSVSTCLKYAWASRPTSGCSEIAFGSGDVINGPAHSNDTMRICDATFKGIVTTANNPPTGLKYTPLASNNNSCSGQVFELGKPAYSPQIAMPAANSQLKKETRSDLTGVDVPRPGCLYTGPTTITFNDAGTVTIRSPWTKKTNVAGEPPAAITGTTPTACGNVGTASGRLGSTGGQTIAIPDNNVIYVQNVPTATGDPNYSANPPSGLSVTSGENGSNGLGYPTSNEDAPFGATAALPAYGLRNGDAFVKGTVKGKVTVASENYIYVVNNLTYADSGRDLLGLVGNNAVFVWNPMNLTSTQTNVWVNNVNSYLNAGWECEETSSNRYRCDDYTSLLGGTDRSIDAAILSVQHTFQVQNYSRGDNRGTLNVTGAIAQKFRGIVRSGSRGYGKNYVYDGRFRYTAPPKFLSPVTVTYGVNEWIEVSAVFNSDGTYR